MGEANITSEEAVAFDRCIGLMTNMMVKYGPRILEKRKKKAILLKPIIDKKKPLDQDIRNKRMLAYAEKLYIHCVYL